MISSALAGVAVPITLNPNELVWFTTSFWTVVIIDDKDRSLLLS